MVTLVCTSDETCITLCLEYKIWNHAEFSSKYLGLLALLQASELIRHLSQHKGKCYDAVLWFGYKFISNQLNTTIYMQQDAILNFSHWFVFVHHSTAWHDFCTKSI